MYVYVCIYVCIYIYIFVKLRKNSSSKPAPANSLVMFGVRKSMYQIEATVGMEQHISLDIMVAAAEGNCLGTRSQAMSTHQDLKPEPHTTSKRISKDRQKGPVYM